MDLPNTLSSSLKCINGFPPHYSPTRVLVKVIGQRPENILLMIHEVFESLIADFFQGIKYEYQIPCPDCIEVHIEDPTMFSSKVSTKYSPHSP